MGVTPAAVAAEVFGFGRLRPGQEEAAGALACGRDCLVIMPSSAGKSAIYQIAAIMLGGPAVVVSPLLSLQRDQARHLREHGQTAIAVNAASSARNRGEAFTLLREGRRGFIFLAPEQLARDDVRNALAGSPPKLIAVDEAHCVSAWGHDFRPDYLRVGAVIGSLAPRPVVAALTATAAPPAREEIAQRLGLRRTRAVIRGSTGRRFTCRCGPSTTARTKMLLSWTRSGSWRGPASCTPPPAGRRVIWPGGWAPVYHAGLRRAEREAAQRAFTGGQTLVATSAFGMGVDQPGVRFVVHAAVPGSLDEYYQEIGRSGRDGRPAAAVCCYRPEDLALPRFFAGGLPDEGQLVTVAQAVRHRSLERSRVEMMRRYAELTDCRRRFLLGYFGERVNEPCGRCDNCDAGRSSPAHPEDEVLPAGTRVEHLDWGSGTVLDGDGDRMRVLFDEVGYKELATRIVLERRVLSPAAG